MPERLQELKLSVLDDRECVQLSNHDKSLVNVNIQLELCAGKKNFIPEYPIYTKMVNGSKVRGICFTRPMPRLIPTFFFS